MTCCAIHAKQKLNNKLRDAIKLKLGGCTPPDYVKVKLSFGSADLIRFGVVIEISIDSIVSVLSNEQNQGT